MTNVSPIFTPYDPANLNNERGRGSNQRIKEMTWLVRPFAGPNTANYEGPVFWYAGQNKGDTSIEETISTFINKSGVIEKDFAVHKIGATLPFTISLTNYTDYIENLCNNTDEAITYAGTAFPGTRTETLTLSATLITANIFGWTFNTRNAAGVLTSTVIATTFITDAATTMAAIITAIEANPGINAAGTSFTGLVITVVANPGYIITTTVAAAVTAGASQATVTPLLTDTSIVTVTVDNATGTINNFGFGVVSAATLAACPNGGIGAQLNILTGNSIIGTMYEQPHVKAIDGNVITLEESLSQLPLDAAVATVIGKTTFGSGGPRLANKLEIKLEGDDHSGLNKSSLYFYEVQVISGKKMQTNEGEVAELKCLALYKRTGSGSTARYKPFVDFKIPSRAGVL